MTATSYKNGLLQMENVPLQRIAQKHGTPVYCYSTRQLADNFHAYQTALSDIMPEDKFTICYACKANSNQAILHLLGMLGAGADVVSGGEMYRAFKAGVTHDKMVFSGVGKTADEIVKAVRNDILQINVESEPELNLVSTLAAKESSAKAHIALRVNPDVDANTHEKITTGRSGNKFGIDIKAAPALYRRARDMAGLAPTGVAVHIGSQLMDLAPFAEAFKRVAELVNELRQQGNIITTVDLGGGLGVPYRGETPPDIKKYAGLIRDIILPLNVHVILEPGRSIAADAGVLLTRVRYIKESGDKRFLIVDAGMNDLARPALYDAYHAIMPCGEPAKGAVMTAYDVVGPVCETSDTFRTGAELPRIDPDALLAIMTAGAYGASMASNYNTRPLPAEVLVSDEQFDLIRPAQKIEDIAAADVIPDWLA
ncbi:MAG: diaminopimelate decarboxylase [Alphaproteobacteria bacterium]|nr:diaminopimelate decarboxylase [Alphaproteobacteria bacterium]MDE2335741.1 diaminopimelate decarboxylase [Alphaproteobacteria bacterium]